jgi:hypothetical protein
MARSGDSDEMQLETQRTPDGVRLASIGGLAGYRRA